MMRVMTVTLTMGLALALGACANGDSLLGFGDQSAQTAALPAKPAADPACTSLAARIDALRSEGVVEKVEAASKGKGANVSVKRASLSQIAELEKANAEFQSKCSTIPRPAAAAPAAPAQKTAAVAPKPVPAKPAAKTPAPAEQPAPPKD